MARENRMKFTREEKEDMAAAIREYFRKERDEDIGNLASLMVLDFIIEELGPWFYNRGVEDARSYMSERLEDAGSLLI